LATGGMKLDPSEEEEFLKAIVRAFFLLLFLFSGVIILVSWYNGQF